MDLIACSQARLLWWVPNKPTRCPTYHLPTTVQLRYAPLSKTEIKLVEAAIRHGAPVALEKAEKVGANISEAVKELIRTGTVQLTLHNVQSVALKSSIRTPYAKAQLKVREADHHTSMAMANRKGSVSFPSPIAVHVGLDAVEDPETRGWLESGYGFGWVAETCRVIVSSVHLGIVGLRACA